MRNVADVRDKSDKGWMPWNHGLHFALRNGLVAWSRPNIPWKWNERLWRNSQCNTFRDFCVSCRGSELFFLDRGVFFYRHLISHCSFIMAWWNILFFLVFTCMWYGRFEYLVITKTYPWLHRANRCS